ncbi:glucose-6-phosphate dehydrogenase assembly protein OpcA [Haloechinothrix sp. YIM 98757]|uniref:Glucose-6-phosphate dehydrogenase assembly protein OpcA n=1 Tax=Haloechinothrix aidingensis TaxID=2752311 RepID=A0A838A908_9PSEU|nr:glucose-6-phosphate dehydrogenase assembly protein OpcA [Haloechinothrix aidingensis]
MIVDLPETTTSQVNERLVELREHGGQVALGRVLTLVVPLDGHDGVEQAISAANEASREHPCRILVTVSGSPEAATRIDGQIRIGGDAGASEVVVFWLSGELVRHAESAVVPLLLPDAPIVTWWPSFGPQAPIRHPLGALAQRRITDSEAEHDPLTALRARARSYCPGDTDLAWARLTYWRAQLVAALDLPPYEDVTAARITGEPRSPSVHLLAGWLAEYLGVRVRVSDNPASGATVGGITAVALDRPSGPVELYRPDGRVGTLTQPDQPPRTIALPRRTTAQTLTEELRRLETDEVYGVALHGTANRTDDGTGTDS